MLKVSQILMMCFLSLNVLSQSDSLQIGDTAISSVDQFIDRVARIEFVNINPVCNIEYSRVKNRIWKKKVNVCYAESVLRCNQINEEITCEIDYSKVVNNKTISQNDADSVLQLVFTSESEAYLTTCYMPRHGMIFYDKSDVKIGFVEICFECSQSINALEIPDFNLLPHSAFEKLRRLFDNYEFP